MRVVCSIAGSDSSAGAGIQADLKATSQFYACYCATVITAVTAQNTLGVQDAYQLPTTIVRAQIESVFSDLNVHVVKTGMLGDAEMINTVAEELETRRPPKIVVDPVMISKTGFPLLADEAVETFKARIVPLATLITPNTHEAERLTGSRVKSIADAEQAGRALLELGASAALVKGGHLAESPGTDVLVTEDETRLIEREWIETKHTHGTGCTYASAIAARLAYSQEWPLYECVISAKYWLTEAIRYGIGLGHGVGPTQPFWDGEWGGFHD
ncbi:MAG: bifunctional hydroxymethylpyrimidine kinase/phosphomethylpyrimidine kinase [Chloroflexi bacterium]|nr:bifunctional hydroxymethylpyrimidine kinase/phosphomethylpyrimidine kinase [Chloroflexota bacterium]